MTDRVQRSIPGPIAGLEDVAVNQFFSTSNRDSEAYGAVVGATGVFVVEAHGLPAFEKAFAVLERRAVKLGVEVPTYEILATVESYEWVTQNHNPNPTEDEDGNPVADPFAHVHGVDGLEWEHFDVTKRRIIDNGDGTTSTVRVDRFLPNPWSVVGSELRDRRHWAIDTLDPYYLVKVAGPKVQFDGWQFVAVLKPVAIAEEFGGGHSFLTHKLPGSDAVLPTRFIPGQPDAVDPYHCDHCGHARARKNTFVLAHEDGRFFQVGSTCLKSFLHGQSAEDIVQFYGSLEEVSSDPEEGYFKTKSKDSYSVQFYVSLAARVTRQFGWKSKSSAQSSLQSVKTTADDIRDQIDILQETAEGKRLLSIGVPRLEVEAVDTKLAASALAWVVATKKHASEGFDANLFTASISAVVTNFTKGVLAYVPTAYARGIEGEVKRRVEQAGKPVSSAQGKVGDKLTISLTVVGLRGFENQWGTSILVKFVDPSGNTYSWFTSSAVPVLGASATVVGTVKDHKEFKGAVDTVLTRVKPVKGQSWETTDDYSGISFGKGS